MTHIIHFTKKFETLSQILQALSFRIFYCQEDFYLGDKKVSSAVHPMVSFSEYSLNNINDQSITYGKYGIALSKSWALRKNLHPVLYIDNNSLVAEALGKLLRARRNKESGLPTNLRLPVMTIKCFTKNAVGYNSYFEVPDFEFRSENEWRYIPKKKDIGGNLISNRKKFYLKNKDYYNNKLSKYSLKFSLPDVKAIFVKNEAEKQEILNFLSIKRNKILIAKWSTNLPIINKSNFQ